MIHIVFNEAEGTLMHKVLELDETLAGPVSVSYTHLDVYKIQVVNRSIAMG